MFEVCGDVLAAVLSGRRHVKLALQQCVFGPFCVRMLQATVI